MTENQKKALFGEAVFRSDEDPEQVKFQDDGTRYVDDQGTDPLTGKPLPPRIEKVNI